MKKFFGKIKDWFKRHKPSKRRLIQVYAALLYNANIKGFISGSIYKGSVKQFCVPGLNCYSCPGASGACPLGALQNALAASGTKAPFYVIGILLLMGLIFGRTICGFLCPVGLGQELLYKIKTPKLKKSRYTRIASYLKYVILIVMVIAIPLSFGSSLIGTAVPAFCKYICPAGTFGGAIGLLMNPSNGSLFDQLGSLFTWKFGVLCAMIVACVFIYRFFCRFFCPLGALYGLFSRFALLGIKLDKNKCTDCGLCLNVCKMDIKRVGDHECIHCGDCISACPARAIRWKGSKLFVHENAVDAGSPSEEKPLGAFLQKDTAASAAPAAVTVETAAETEIAKETVTAETPQQTARRREQKRNFWLQFAAWTAALALLIGAFVYYNFIDSDAVKEGVPCPEFTAEIYGGSADEPFSITDTRGNITVLYFWDGDDGGSSVSEIAEAAGLIQTNYNVTVKAVAVTAAAEETVERLISESDWGQFSITFVKDDGAVRDLFPREDETNYCMTLILDADGLIWEMTESALSAEELYKNINVLFTGSNVGDLCPEFTVELYNGEGGTYNLLQSRGKITIINFWATWCGPCVAELPYFEQLQREYPDDVAVIAISEDLPTVDVRSYIDSVTSAKESWSDYMILFAQDAITGNSGELYTTLSHVDVLPVTLVLDQEGRIVYNSPKSISYEALIEIVTPLLGE